MVYDFLLTFFFTFLLVSIISFILNTYLPKGKAEQKKGVVILLIQSLVISFLLTWII
ncbi:MAG TPA: hypothetical protein VEY51_03895 [Chondromyces sp.]|nr:hypothetical protein [Chondromyces sp.]